MESLEETGRPRNRPERKLRSVPPYADDPLGSIESCMGRRARFVGSAVVPLENLDLIFSPLKD